jgi:hypothetical protein
LSGNSFESLLPAQPGQRIASGRQIRVEAKRKFVLPGSPQRLACLLQSDRQIEMGLRRIGIDPQSFFVMPNRFA